MTLRRPSATRRPAAAASAREEAESLKTAIVNAALNAVVVSDGEGRIIEFNPAAERMFGRSARDAFALRMSDILVPSGPIDPDLSGNLLSVLGQRVVLEARRSDGALFPVEIAIQRVTSPSRTLFAAYIRDLSSERAAAAALEDQRERARRLEKFSAMSALLGGVAHELNNPLAILLTQSTLLVEKAPDQEVARRAEKIHAAAQRAGRIVKSFLSMGQQRPPRPEILDLDIVVDEALELVGYGLRSAGIDVVREIDPALPAVEADRDLIRQALACLFVNAQEALTRRPAGRRLIIRARGARDVVEIEIHDNGPGIPVPIANRIFEPYFTTKPAGTGTGIGLSLSRSILEAHGGSIRAVPEAAGATLLLSLPRREMPAHGPAADHAGGPGSLAVLVVDDEPEVAQALAELIELFGHRVEVATDAGSALRFAAGMCFDAVFSDLRMPDMDGRALREALLAANPHLAKRIVIVTGDVVFRSSDADDIQEEFVLGKPFAASEVKLILDRISA